MMGMRSGEYLHTSSWHLKEEVPDDEEDDEQCGEDPPEDEGDHGLL